MSDRESWMELIRNEYDPAPAHYRMGDDWDDGAGRIADAILADIELARRTAVAATPTREAAIKKIDEWTGEVLKRGFASSWHYGELADALAAPQAQEGRDAVIEECAKVLDACAQDWHRIRDPGMANNAKAYAKKIRALAAPVSRPLRGAE